VEEAFRGTTLAEVVSDTSRSVPLCNFPASKQRAKDA
jgi:hypothetical protein